MQTYNQDVLSASHTMLAYPAFLAGYRTVDDALNDRLFTNYISAFLDQDVAHLLDSDENTELVNLLSKSDMSDSLTQLCFEGTSRLSAVVLPTLCELLAKNGDVHRIAFLLAAYGHYLSTSTDDQGVAYEINDPHLDHTDWAKINDSDVVALLGISPLASARLQTFSHFVTLYKSYRAQIAQLGVVFLLKQMAYNRLAMR
ncbi:mannitol dehydrogenase family protein [Spirosoma koreense]